MVNFISNFKLDFNFIAKLKAFNNQRHEIRLLKKIRKWRIDQINQQLVY